MVLELSPRETYHLKSLDSPGRFAIEQYMQIAGAHNSLWQEIYLRTATKEWVTDGFGSCDITKEDSEIGIIEEIKPDLIGLREIRNEETDGKRNRRGCPNHRDGAGCILGNLKSPHCLDYMPFYLDDEIEQRFGICLMPIKPYLDRVSNLQNSNMGETEKFTSDTLEAIEKLTDYIKSFPCSDITKN